MAKPKSEKCESCFVVNNKLRCSMCKHAPKEWIFSDDGACVVGGFDMYKEKEDQTNDV